MAGQNLKPTIAYVIDPRFPGGTSSAVARELVHAREAGHLTVACLTTAMFPNRPIAPALDTAFSRLNIEPVFDPPQIAADLVVLHNPAMLKFDPRLTSRITARRLVVVTHENFLRPDGFETFDIAGCLGRIDSASLAVEKCLAPVSPWNRKTVTDWLAANPGTPWRLTEANWFNICDFEMAPPTPAPADRRGRLSRPGFEKFPGLAALDACFPASAQSNLILGADSLIAEGHRRAHWSLIPFGGMSPEDALAAMDFMIYFTAPGYRDSFGRVVAEGIAAGKVVITDPDTAAPFGPGVVAAAPQDVDSTIAALIARPDLYAGLVARAQADLARYSATEFRSMLTRHLPAAQTRAA